MAKKYIIEIEETLSKRIYITADSEEDALKIIRRQYYNTNVVLDENDFNHVEFKVIGEKDSKSE